MFRLNAVCLGLVALCALFLNPIAGSSQSLQPPADWLPVGFPIDGSASEFLASDIDVNSDGTRMIFGVPSAVDEFAAVYEEVAGDWVLVNAIIPPTVANISHGYRVAMSQDGNTVAVSAILAPDNGTNSGHVRIFSDSGTSWDQVGSNIAGPAGDRFGGTVAMNADGSIVAVATPGNDDFLSNAGKVQIFQFQTSDWVQIGQNIYGEASSDFSGKSIDLSDDGLTIAIGAPNNDDGGSNSGQVRVYAFDGLLWQQVGADLDGQASGEALGESVGISADGSIVAAGAPNADVPFNNAGCARVWEYTTSWTQVGLDINGGFDSESLGESIGLSADGSRLSVSGPNPSSAANLSGRVLTFENLGGGWNQLGSAIVESTLDGNFGNTLALSSDGSTVVFSDNLDDTTGDNAGRVFAYRYGDLPAIIPDLNPLPDVFATCIVQGITAPTATASDGSTITGTTAASFPITAPGTTVVTWTYDDGLGNTLDQDQLVIIQPNTDPPTWNTVGSALPGSENADSYGNGVAISLNGQVMAAGAPGSDLYGFNRGYVRVYEWNDGDWAQIGDDIQGGLNGEQSGRSVALSEDGSIVAIGAPWHNVPGSQAGAARVYQRLGDSWIPLGNELFGDQSGDYFGNDVALSADGQYLAVGAGQEGVAEDNPGYVRVYTLETGLWVQVGNDILGDDEDDWLGLSVSLDASGGIVACGAPGNDDEILGSGEVKVFEWNGQWEQLGSDLSGTNLGARFGWAVELSADGSRLAVGAPEHNGAGDTRGRTIVVEYDGASWIQIGSGIDGDENFDRSGEGIAFSADGKILAVGEPSWTDDIISQGRARLYREEGGSWIALGAPVIGNQSAGNVGEDNSLALSADGRRLLYGTPNGFILGEESGFAEVAELEEYQVIVPDISPLPIVYEDCGVLAMDAPTATAECGDVLVGTTSTSFPIIPSGTHIVEWLFDDGAGNTFVQPQIVVIALGGAPVPVESSLPDITMECSIDDLPAPIAMDVCDGMITGVPDVSFPFTDPGTTLMTWSFTDVQGNTTLLQQSLTIEPSTGGETPIVPDLFVLPTITVACQLDAADPPTATTACGVTIFGQTLVSFPADDVTTIAWIFSDGFGNGEIQGQDVVITNSVPPVPDLATLPDVASECSVEFLTPPTATDDCTSDLTISSDASFPITASGTTVVTWTISDFQGNSVQQTQNVIIEDSTAPVPDIATLPDLVDECEITPPQATDNCSGTVIATTSDPLMYEEAGTYTVTWVYADAAGNQSMQDQDVIVNSPCVLTTGCFGDLDGDGFISTNDLLDVIAEFSCTLDCNFDLTGDGVIGTADIIALLGVFGTTCPYE